jgi:DNA-3-methyladenine glycosylase II
MQKTVTEKNLPGLCRKLSAKDKDLAFVFKKYGAPPLWSREANFATLVQIILEQQVSLASAAAAFNKLCGKIGAVTPENVLQLSDAELKSCYFSRQKSGYARNLAEAVLSGTLDLEKLSAKSDADVRLELTQIKGIGRWTSDIYLLMALLRPDIMPKGDLALHAAFQKLKNLEKRPATDEFIQLTESWRPFRSVAARLLWHFYLSEKADS